MEGQAVLQESEVDQAQGRALEMIGGETLSDARKISFIYPSKLGGEWGC